MRVAARLFSASFTDGTLTPGPSPRGSGEQISHIETKSAAPSRARIVAAARAWLGTPYVHQASAQGTGCDCLGLIRGLYTELLGREPEAPPPYTPDWNERSPLEEPLLSAARRHLVEALDRTPPPSPSATPPPQAGEEGLCRTQTPSSASSFSPRAPSSPVLYLGGGPQGRRGCADARLRPGQVLIFRIVTTGPAKHCGIVASNETFIHAYAGRSVVESWLSRFWTERIAGVFEFPGVEE